MRNKYINISWILISLIMISGCDSKPSVEMYLKRVDISKLSSYKILHRESSGGLGDIVENYTLIISKKDYNLFVNRIKNKPFFSLYDSTDIPEHAYRENYNRDKINLKAYSYKNKIYFEYLDPKDLKNIVIVLYNDSLMDVECIQP